MLKEGNGGVGDKNVNVSLQIWDIGGQSIGGKMIDKYIFGADAVVLVYDITNLESFQDLEDWYRLVKRSVMGGGKKGNSNGNNGGKSNIFSTGEESKDNNNNGNKKLDETEVKAPVILLMSNKNDLDHLRQVPRKSAKQFAQENNFIQAHVSAKSGDQITPSFYQLASELAGVFLPKSDIEGVTEVVVASIETGEARHDADVGGGRVPELVGERKCAIS